MSQPASLYARFTLSHEQYEAFMNSTPARPVSFDDWQSWFDRHAVRGIGKAAAEMLADLDAPTVADLIKAWRQDEWTGTPPVEYNEINRTLHIAMLRVSENLTERLRILSPLRAAGAFNEPAANDFIAIFDFLRDDGSVAAYVQLHEGKSRFGSELAPAHRKEAETYLQEVQAYLRSRSN